MVADFLRRGMYGFAMGDAFGFPYEFKQIQGPVSPQMMGTGEWSDDTSLVLATINALYTAYDPQIVMDNFVEYLYEGAFTPNNQAFGYGEETQAAIEAYKNSGKFGDFNQDDPMANGNGALMRIWPMAFYQVPAQFTLEQIVDELTGLTHGPMTSKLVSRFWVYFIRVLPRMKNVEHALAQAIRSINRQPAIQALLEKNDLDWLVLYDLKPSEVIQNIRDRPASEIKPTGYVVDTLNTVLWIVLNTDQYTDAILKVVNLGGDTDTNAALVGLVMSYIDDEFDNQWFEHLAHKEKIERELVLASHSQAFD